MEIPNELLVQVEKVENFEKLKQHQKEKEINHCISRCLMNLEEYPEKSRYFRQQIRQLERLLKIIRGE